MSQLNVFMNAYQQPENKLTYNFLCLIENMPNNKQFIEFLTDEKFILSQQPLVSIQSVFGGYEANPDGLFIVSTHDDKNINIYFENKTFRLSLTKEQILRHVSTFCQNNNSFLLVVTPRPADKTIIEDCIKNVGQKLFFKTWTEVSQQLQNTEKSNPAFIVSQFIEYGKLSGEFMSMQLTDADFRIYIDYYKNNVESKIEQSLENSTVDIDYSQFNNSIRRVEFKNHWGRMGYEYEFTNNYGMWFFYGVYFSSADHGIKFKKDSEPEIAFFFRVVHQ